MTSDFQIIIIILVAKLKKEKMERVMLRTSMQA